VQRLTVFGAGLMGAGIAQVGAQNGLKVCTQPRGIIVRC
jgi:3-hydroxyacyl-CoA dehydrogenase